MTSGSRLQKPDCARRIPPGSAMLRAAPRIDPRRPSGRLHSSRSRRRAGCQPGTRCGARAADRRAQPRQCLMLVRACTPAISDHIGRAAREIPNGNRKTAKSTALPPAQHKGRSVCHHIPLALAACAASACRVSSPGYNLWPFAWNFDPNDVSLPPPAAFT